ncbi:hypothetical protein CEXT_624651 [Caerostris extrusa]|uniref:Uncharacterized protein n=1 Tax=Caerostris extrusa TaxID=172846 RepID=A0AAV4PVC6_CAEEX|nr:hypothetical protein CEXT_624651 [Caerostris extrusa]
MSYARVHRLQQEFSSAIERGIRHSGNLWSGLHKNVPRKPFAFQFGSDQPEHLMSDARVLIACSAIERGSDDPESSLSGVNKNVPSL